MRLAAKAHPPPPGRAISLIGAESDDRLRQIARCRGKSPRQGEELPRQEQWHGNHPASSSAPIDTAAPSGAHEANQRSGITKIKPPAANTTRAPGGPSPSSTSVSLRAARAITGVQGREATTERRAREDGHVSR
jgi:hypothetical protein